MFRFQINRVFEEDVTRRLDSLQKSVNIRTHEQYQQFQKFRAQQLQQFDEETRAAEEKLRNLNCQILTQESNVEACTTRLAHLQSQIEAKTIEITEQETRINQIRVLQETPLEDHIIQMLQRVDQLAERERRLNDEEKRLEDWNAQCKLEDTKRKGLIQTQQKTREEREAEHQKRVQKLEETEKSLVEKVNTLQLQIQYLQTQQHDWSLNFHPSSLNYFKSECGLLTIV